MANLTAGPISSGSYWNQSNANGGYTLSSIDGKSAVIVGASTFVNISGPVQGSSHVEVTAGGDVNVGDVASHTFVQITAPAGKVTIKSMDTNSAVRVILAQSIDIPGGLHNQSALEYLATIPVTTGKVDGGSGTFPKPHF